MRAALLAALHRSPWLFVVVTFAALFALWLVMTHSYAFSVRSSSGLRLELTPAITR